MLTRIAIIEQITVLKDGQIRVTRVNKIFEDGVEIATEQPHQHTINPGDNLTGEDPRVQKVAKAVHTPKVVADYRAAIAA